MPTTDQDSMLETLRAERNRFFAFAFAAADLVLEIDAIGTVTFAAGAGRELLGSDVEQLQGMNFYRLLSADDRLAIHAALAAVELGARSSTLSAHALDGEGPGRRLDLRAYRPADANGSIFLTFRDRGAGDDPAMTSHLVRNMAGEPDLNRFARAVARRMSTVQIGDAPLALTLIALNSTAATTAAPDGEAARPLMSAIADLLRLYAQGSDDVGYLGAGKIGVVHAADQSFGSIADGVIDINA